MTLLNRQQLLSYLKYDKIIYIIDYIRCDTRLLEQYIKDWQKLRFELRFKKNQQIMNGKKVYYSRYEDINIYNIIVKNEDDLTHECFVGIYLNEIRKKIPNFVITFGTGRCGKSIGKSGESQLCMGNLSERATETHYLVIEKCKGRTLSSFLKTATLEAIKQVYGQILLALQVAYDVYEFVHYDLHCQNVIVQELANEICVKYETKHGIFHCKSKYIPCIIDFGLSRIKVDNLVYGYDFRKYLIIPDFPNINYDIAKLFGDGLLTYNKGYDNFFTDVLAEIVPKNEIIEFCKGQIIDKNAFIIYPYIESQKPHIYYFKKYFMDNEVFTLTKQPGELYGCTNCILPVNIQNSDTYTFVQLCEMLLIDKLPWANLKMTCEQFLILAKKDIDPVIISLNTQNMDNLIFVSTFQKLVAYKQLLQEILNLDVINYKCKFEDLYIYVKQTCLKYETKANNIITMLNELK